MWRFHGGLFVHEPGSKRRICVPDSPNYPAPRHLLLGEGSKRKGHHHGTSPSSSYGARRKGCRMGNSWKTVSSLSNGWAWFQVSKQSTSACPHVVSGLSREQTDGDIETTLMTASSSVRHQRRQGPMKKPKGNSDQQKLSRREAPCGSPQTSTRPAPCHAADRSSSRLFLSCPRSGR